MAVQESSLRVGVDSRDMVTGARQGEGALDRLGRKANATESQFDKLEKQTGGLKAAFASLGIGLAVRQFSQLLDSATNVGNRLRLVTDSTAELNATYDQLLSISNETRSSLESNAALFNRMALATDQLGMSTQETLDFTRSLNQALVISGATAAEGGAALLQLSQGLAAGALRGEELNSILEATPVVANVIAEGLGVARGELKQLGADGKISAEAVVEAFKAAADDLDQQFGLIAPTISGASVIISNTLREYVRDLNEATGVGSIFVAGALLVADNFDQIAAAALSVAAVITASVIPSIVAMGVALAASPLGLVAGAAAALGVALSLLNDQTITLGDNTATLGQLFSVVWGDLVSIISTVYTQAVLLFRGFVGWFRGFITNSDTAWEALQDGAKTAVNFVIALAKSMSDIWAAVFEGIWTAAKVTFGGVGQAASTLAEALQMAFTGNFSGAQNLLENMFAGFEYSRVADVVSSTAREVGENFRRDFVGEAGGFLVSYVRDALGRVEGDAEFVDPEILNRTAEGFQRVAQAAGGSGGATEEVRRFIDSLNDQYEKVREQSGGAVEALQNWYDRTRERIGELGLRWEDYADKVETIFAERLEDAYRKDLDAATDWRSGLERAMLDIGDSVAQTEADLMEGAFTSAFDKMAGALSDFVMTGKLDFADLARSIIADIIQMTTRMLLFKAISSVVGFSEGGMVGGFASGGFVSGPGGPTSDSIPAMLSDGEYVVNAAATREFLPLLSAINAGDIKRYSLGGLVDGESGAAGSVGMSTVNVTIQTRDAESFRQSRGQVSADIARAVAFGQRNM